MILNQNNELELSIPEQLRVHDYKQDIMNMIIDKLNLIKDIDKFVNECIQDVWSQKKDSHSWMDVEHLLNTKFIILKENLDLSKYPKISLDIATVVNPKK